MKLIRICGMLALLGTGSIALADECPAGQYSDTGMEPCMLATPGYYVPSFGATEVIAASPGYYVPGYGATEQIKASAGYFVPNSGASSKTAASPGSYVASTGATAQTPTSVGSYSSGSGSTGQTAASRGYFSSDIGSSEQTAADAGSYQDQEGQGSAILAPAGYFSPVPGSVVPNPTAPGEFTAAPGESSTTACSAGTASRGGASACTRVGADVPAELGPNFVTDLPFGEDIDFGTLIVDQITGETNTEIFQLTIFNDVPVYDDIDSELTALTLLDVFIEGPDAELFSLLDFVEGTVLLAGESIVYDIMIDSVLGDAPRDFIAELIFRTDQGNVFGFDPTSIFDELAVEESYQAFRDAGYPSTIGELLPLSQEFAFTLTANVSGPVGLAASAQIPEPSSLALFLLGGLALNLRWRRRIIRHI